MSASSNAYRKAARQLAQKTANSRTARAAIAAADGNQIIERSIIGSFKLPGTLIAPPVFRSIFQSPVEGVKMQGLRVMAKSLDAFRMVASYIASKPSLLASGSLQVQRSRIVPTAKGLHRSLSGAFAAGDLDTLRRVCHSNLYQTLSTKILQRPAGVRKDWELVSYTGTLMYPRIVDHKIMEVPLRDGSKVTVHQAVVTIRSRQRLTQFNDKTGESTGPSKELDVTEHLIMLRELDPNGSPPGDWKVFGYADETTYQDWLKEKHGLDLLMKQAKAQR
ncbi:uncharacterized protein PgNI_00272 [Pyricularia grisea]|uniref:Tim44-like domain-containing protein n=1 Tax=Pyricularia grisea TaxID=148305 RepID=A0A6P8BKG3_PYRGI|nr:uncharacterized protein PgNI_00272 [Pyricularia grisea]TLD17278.1 hypothetical protein PgNI_00272 [Pyricularia grisea]